MIDLFELAQCVRVELAVSSQQVQLAQELRGLLRQKLAMDVGSLDLPSQTGTTSLTWGMVSRSRCSIPILSVISEEGQPLHEPRMCR